MRAWDMGVGVWLGRFTFAFSVVLLCSSYAHPEGRVAPGSEPSRCSQHQRHALHLDGTPLDQGLLIDDPDGSGSPQRASTTHGGAPSGHYRDFAGRLCAHTALSRDLVTALARRFGVLLGHGSDGTAVLVNDETVIKIVVNRPDSLRTQVRTLRALRRLDGAGHTVRVLSAPRETTIDTVSLSTLLMTRLDAPEVAPGVEWVRACLAAAHPKRLCTDVMLAWADLLANRAAVPLLDAAPNNYFIRGDPKAVAARVITASPTWCPTVSDLAQRLLKGQGYHGSFTPLEQCACLQGPKRGAVSCILDRTANASLPKAHRWLRTLTDYGHLLPPAPSDRSHLWTILSESITWLDP